MLYDIKLTKLIGKKYLGLHDTLLRMTTLMHIKLLTLSKPMVIYRVPSGDVTIFFSTRVPSGDVTFFFSTHFTVTLHLTSLKA